VTGGPHGTAERVRVVAAGPVVELAHALVVDVADQLGLRALVVKGVGAEHHCLRPPRVAADVDVLVGSVADADRMGAELARRGWARRPADADVAVFPRHSDTWFHPGWSCDLDVHHRFPGLDDTADRAGGATLRDGATTASSPSFDVLWQDRVVLRQGGRDVAVPGRAATLLLLALHGARSPWVTRHAVELESLLEPARTLPRDELVDLARRLGALAPLRPFLETAFGPVELDWGTPSAEWRLRTRHASPTARRLVLLAASSRRERLRALRLAVLPPRETLLKDGLGGRLGVLGTVRAYGARWARGARSLPAAWREARGA
jgi:hypothetical protein